MLFIIQYLIEIFIFIIFFPIWNNPKNKNIIRKMAAEKIYGNLKKERKKIYIKKDNVRVVCNKIEEKG